MRFIVTYIDKYGDTCNHDIDSFHELKKFINEINKQSINTLYLQIKNKK